MHPNLYKNVSASKSDCQYMLTGHRHIPLYKKYEDLLNFVKTNNISKDSYCKSTFVQDYEDKFAAFCGQEKSLFMPTGAMAQLIACRIWSDRIGTNKIVMHHSCQMEVNEFHSYKELHYLEPIFFNVKDRQFDFEEIENLPEAAIFILENPMRYFGGLAFDLETIKKLKTILNKKGIKFHLDGARLFSCLPYLKLEAREICSYFDSVYISLYKNICGMSGALLMGDEDFIEEAKTWRRRHGGEMKEVTEIIVGAEIGFRAVLSKTQIWHQKSLEIAEIVNGLDHMRTIPLKPQSNIFHIYFDRSATEMCEIHDEICRETGVWMFDFLIQSTNNPNESYSEVAIYDAATDIDKTILVNVFEKLNEKLKSA